MASAWQQTYLSLLLTLNTAVVVFGELDEKPLLGPGEHVTIHELERVLGFSPRVELHEGRAAANCGLRVHQGAALDDLPVLWQFEVGKDLGKHQKRWL